MNQGIAFGRTIRALDADDFRASKLGLQAALALLAAWTGWMVAARVPQYESTNNVRIESGHITAYFLPDAASRVRVDQPAIVRLNGGSFPARVQTVASDHVELLLASPQSPTPTSASAVAEVEVSRASPVALFLRALRGAAR